MVIDKRIIQERISKVRQEIAAAAQKAGRDPEQITLLGVSKQFPAATALAACQAGLQDLAENRVDELLAKQKYCRLAGASPLWHLIGTLQRRKVRQVIGHTHLVHSVDTEDLLLEINKRSQSAGLKTAVLLQYNSTQEANKHGFTADELQAAAVQAATLPGIRLCGLMTMARLTTDPETTRPAFQKTQELFYGIRDLLADPADFSVLSMGMSQDFPQAIEYGATHVRIGQAIFGSREKT